MSNELNRNRKFRYFLLGIKCFLGFHSWEYWSILTTIFGVKGKLIVKSCEICQHISELHEFIPDKKPRRDSYNSELGDMFTSINEQVKEIMK